MRKYNQSGLTLIEVLVTLTILSFIGAIIWNVFYQGTEYSHKAMTKNQMQQEANIIISRLLQIHQTSERYVIKNPDCSISVTYKEKDQAEKSETFENSQLCYYIDRSENTEDNQTSFTPIEVYDEDILKDIWIRIEDKQDPTNKIKVETYLYRLKGETSHE